MKGCPLKMKMMCVFIALLVAKHRIRTLDFVAI